MMMGVCLCRPAGHILLSHLLLPRSFIGSLADVFAEMTVENRPMPCNLRAGLRSIQMFSFLFSLQGWSVAVLCSTAVLLPTSRVPADKWAEKVFPDPLECDFKEGAISYYADDKAINITVAVPNEVKASLKAMESKITATCTPNETGLLDIPTSGEFFGSRYTQFSMPIYALETGGGCMSPFYYSFSFPEKAQTLHDNILQRTGRDLKVLSGSGQNGSIDDRGWITDYGDHSVYFCSMEEGF